MPKNYICLLHFVRKEKRSESVYYLSVPCVWWPNPTWWWCLFLLSLKHKYCTLEALSLTEADITSVPVVCVYEREREIRNWTILPKDRTPLLDVGLPVSGIPTRALSWKGMMHRTWVWGQLVRLGRPEALLSRKDKEAKTVLGQVADMTIHQRAVLLHSNSHCTLHNLCCCCYVWNIHIMFAVLLNIITSAFSLSLSLSLLCVFGWVELPWSWLRLKQLLCALCGRPRMVGWIANNEIIWVLLLFFFSALMQESIGHEGLERAVEDSQLISPLGYLKVVMCLFKWVSVYLHSINMQRLPPPPQDHMLMRLLLIKILGWEGVTLGKRWASMSESKPVPVPTSKMLTLSYPLQN